MKYRIIKSIATDPKEPYFPQYWDEKKLNWEAFQTYASWHCELRDRQYATLKEAKKFLAEQKAQEKVKNTCPEVVWEEEDE